MTLDPIPLSGRHVRLEPYSESLRPALARALDADPAAFDLFTGAGHGEHFEGWWSNAVDSAAAGTAINYAVLHAESGEVLGTTSYLNIERRHAILEIGGTYYVPAARGGRVNPECKRLLLAHAFASGANRVQLVTDARNLRSQAAIAKLGAVREGVLRSHRITWTGWVRDTVVFSILAAEWPAVRAGLDARLA